ncbi:hypothetical protein Moror_5249 [Moniliophthora roreri MCA 2997]|uniref:DUF6534 domain-containing protein n=1 Tax=Moniliophthora roreri (strain MCA 2997) TaxID=1381753 RepID=V2YBV6_MONRO|nr:hypothetical protein Moror_5249 [Moniliophthora roreri MCA 2997]
MADTPPAAVHLELGDTFGAILISVILSSCLYGVVCLQIWYYFRDYKDQLPLRLVVLAVLVLSTLHEVVAMHAVYHYLILNFANPLALERNVWSIVIMVPATAGLNTIVHLFYAARVYWLSNKRGWWISAIVCFLQVVQIALSISVTIRGAQVTNFSVVANDKQLMTMCITSLSCSAAEDVICTLAISYYLHTSRSGIKSTDTLINKLIVHTVNNGALTSVASICIVSVMVPKPKNLLYLAIFEVVGSLYSNSILSTLNSRRSHTQARLPDTIDYSYPSFATSRHTVTGMSRSTYIADTRTIDISKPPMEILVETQSDAHRSEQDMELSDTKVNP